MNTEAAQTDALIVGLARNCEAAIEPEVARLADSFKAFRSVRWLVVESDSSDGTVARLQMLKQRLPGFDYLTLGQLRDTLPKRTQRIAHCRNAYLEELRSNPAYAGVGVVVMADLDGANSLLTADAVRSCFVRNDWSVCTANPAGPYYDIWALRHASWSPGDCWAHNSFLKQLGYDEDAARQLAIYARMITIPPTAPWIEVDSAFGGLALYRREALTHGHYIGLDDQGNELCEHVPFHTQLRTQDHRIFINPGLVNCGFTPHTEEMRRWPRIKRSLRLALKELRKEVRGKRGQAASR